MTSRYWLFTENNPSQDEENPHEAYANVFQAARQFAFLVFQYEAGENGTPHYQGYLGLKNERDRNFIRRNYSGTAHWESRRGTHAEALAYCEKEDSRLLGPWRYGDVPEEAGQGARSDLTAAIVALRGGGLKRVAEEHPEQLVRFHRGLSVLASYLPAPARPLPNVFLYYGRTGVGKTTTAIERTEAMGQRWYKQTPHSKWYDGLQSEPEVLILDEFTGWIPLDFLLNLLDRFRMQLEIKGGHVWVQQSTIYLTSNRHPGSWYDYTNRTTQYAALARRISVVVFPERELGGAELARFWSVDTTGPLVDEWQ